MAAKYFHHGLEQYICTREQSYNSSKIMCIQKHGEQIMCVIREHPPCVGRSPTHVRQESAASPVSVVSSPLSHGSRAAPLRGPPAPTVCVLMSVALRPCTPATAGGLRCGQFRGCLYRLNFRLCHIQENLDIY